MPFSPARLAGRGGGARDRDQAPPHPDIQVGKISSHPDIQVRAILNIQAENIQTLIVNTTIGHAIHYHIFLLIKINSQRGPGPLFLFVVIKYILHSTFFTYSSNIFHSEGLVHPGTYSAQANDSSRQMLVSENKVVEHNHTDDHHDFSFDDCLYGSETDVCLCDFCYML